MSKQNDCHPNNESAILKEKIPSCFCLFFVQICKKIVYNNSCKREQERQKIDKYKYYIIIGYVIACMVPGHNRFFVDCFSQKQRINQIQLIYVRDGENYRKEKER
ncbi:hypothetical protein BpJC7_14750 [Weizmannia acidilactici]|uniref:Transmembrane protein n=1 Tax=Weizmannia acidilactici TaxID=2607726 RepID=A0A5J4J5D1_9BACI|nr:hypothetical protein BpJC4_14860 [Weizmannia acidilactici]GER70172.1 hypothetical protein BpJC7_14750 [Weizmannia acidilactici]GER73268.1 hypothetical protein BpPP18_13350 [Weizmannia acidilactici]